MAKIFTKLNLGDVVASSGGKCFRMLSAKAAEQSGDYLTFSSPSSFTLKTYNGAKNWDGALEYSTDASNWNTWSGTTTLSANSGNLYLRGTGNTKITGNSNNNRWVLTGSNIACEGNIENLLDYATVANGEHPAMADNCYWGLFRGCTSLISAPALPAMTLTPCCYLAMFKGCTSLTSAPELPATTLKNDCYNTMFQDCTGLISAPAILPAETLVNYCYYNMFKGCTSLINVPALPATTLLPYCYEYMFANCTSLTSIPALPATTLQNYCYKAMFEGCTRIKLSATQTEEYCNKYRIPISGVGANAENPTQYMFNKTGGTYKGNPSINTTYYTSNTVVY